MPDPANINHSYVRQQENVSWTSTFLACSTSIQKASEIEGDLLEESAHYGSQWYRFHAICTVLALLSQSFRKAPVFTLMLSFASLAAASVLSTFLLLPFVFQFSHFSETTLLLLVSLFRIIACFIVGAALVEYAGRKGVRAVLGTTMIMLVVLLLGSFIQQQWGVAGDTLLETIFLESALIGKINSISLYTSISISAIIAGGIYSLRNSQKSEFKPGCGRIDSFFSTSDLLKNK